MIELVLVACLLTDPLDYEDFKFNAPNGEGFQACLAIGPEKFEGFQKKNEKTHKVTSWRCRNADEPELEA